MLCYRHNDRGELEILIGHMGGPFFARRDARAWSIPKGEYGADESPLVAARREFVEETGFEAPPGEYLSLGSVRQAGGKLVEAFAVEADFDAEAAVSNTVSLESPRGSGRFVEVPEMDRFAWCDLELAASRLVAAQVELVGRLADALGRNDDN